MNYQFEVLCLARRKAVVHLLRKFVALSPICVAWCTEHFTDLPHLVVLRLAGEKRPHRKEFGHDSSKCEDVYRAVVVWRTEEDLGGAVPSGRDVIGEGRARIAFLGQSEICNFYRLVVAQKILRLQVPMEVIFAVHVR